MYDISQLRVFCVLKPSLINHPNECCYVCMYVEYIIIIILINAWCMICWSKSIFQNNNNNKPPEATYICIMGFTKTEILSIPSPPTNAHQYFKIIKKKKKKRKGIQEGDAPVVTFFRCVARIIH